jgi:hypothetical protein
MKSDVKEAASIERLSHDDVAHLVGDLEDSVVATILATGASYLDIEQAVKWLDAGFEGRLNGHGLTPKGELVCDILLTSGAFADDSDDRIQG